VEDRIPTTHAVLVLVLTFPGTVGCDHSHTTSKDAGAQKLPDCGAILMEPPSITVTDAQTGAPICDPVFSIVDGAGVGVQPPVDPVVSGCHAPGVVVECTLCAYVLGGLTGTGTKYVRVSKPGYQSQVVPVMGGIGGCVPYRPPTHLAVNLVPLVDDGSDAH
jgi:hypothetical protein